jgi:ABC-2 type transport system ATP-binding protein
MIRIKNLSFNYGKRQVFNNFNLDINAGEVTLITGINGVGKSTLLRLLAGVLKPTGGEILYEEYKGRDPKQKIGFISDTPSLYESMKVSRAIDFHQSVYKFAHYDDTLIKRTKIDRDKKIRELSMGQRVIFHLSLILSAEPDVLLVDEILHSIDIYLRGLFLRELIKLLTERKVTVVFVNLNFRDIENMVDRVILLKDGEILVDEKIDDLKAKVKKVICDEPPEGLPVLSFIDYTQQSEFFIYPFREEYRRRINGEVIDLDLTAVVSAFIGGEYV